MNEKTIRTLRKLIDGMPAELREPWRFDASNQGSVHHGWHYGIVSDSTILPGINVDVSSSFRQSLYSDSRPVEDIKLGNTLTAYIATLHPTNVQALLDEIDACRALLLSLKDEFGALADIAGVQPITCDASAFEKLVAEISETLERFSA